MKDHDVARIRAACNLFSPRVEGVYGGSYVWHRVGTLELGELVLVLEIRPYERNFSSGSILVATSLGVGFVRPDALVEEKLL